MNRITTKISMLISKSVKLDFLVCEILVELNGVCIAYQFFRKKISIAVCLV